jgi:hypothetical protein
MLLGTCQHLFKETVGGAVHYIALFEAGIIWLPMFHPWIWCSAGTDPLQWGCISGEG